MSKQLPLAERLMGGMNFLTRVMNVDGGIPAVKPGEPSGCWTTAEALEVILRSPWFDKDFSNPVKQMAQFLLNNQFRTKSDMGGWPLVIGGRRPSTMATAHAVIGLLLAKPFVEHGLNFKLNETIGLGIEWLKKNQSPSSGWGVEPTGGSSGSEPRVVSTFLALRALAQTGESVHTSRCVREGVDFLWSLRRGDGFAPASGRNPNACATVRAFLAIWETGAIEERRDFIQTTLQYILQCKPESRFWDLDTETYIQADAAGQIVFNNNTTAEILEFFILVDNAEELQRGLVEWFQRNQRDDGSWCLGANDRILSDLVTWPTNEAILALSLFIRNYRFVSDNAQGSLTQMQPRLRENIKSWLLWMFASVAVIEGLLLFGLSSYLEKAWSSLPKEYRVTFWWAAIVAIMINLVSTSVVWLGRRIFNSWSKKDVLKKNGT